LQPSNATSPKRKRRLLKVAIALAVTITVFLGAALLTRRMLSRWGARVIAEIENTKSDERSISGTVVLPGRDTIADLTTLIQFSDDSEMDSGRTFGAVARGKELVLPSGALAILTDSTSLGSPFHMAIFESSYMRSSRRIGVLLIRIGADSARIVRLSVYSAGAEGVPHE
jgi:hypothetical protein